MKLMIFLHFYQPYNQQDDILERIVNESYRPLVRGLLERPSKKIVVNVTGGLLELLSSKGYFDVIDGFKKLLTENKVEFVGSAMYHPFLPLLPRSEIVRQIEQNKGAVKRILGDDYRPMGFFPPEMAVNDTVLNTVLHLGYKWVAAPETSLDPLCFAEEVLSQHTIFKDKKTNLFLFFRHKRVSSLILSAVTRSAKDLYQETQDLKDKEGYLFAVMDAETFGHHRVGHEKLLFEILDSNLFELTTINDFLENVEDLEVKEVSVRPSTWTNEEQDFWLDEKRTKGTTAKSFILWKDPENPIHKLQWDLADFVLRTVNDFPRKEEDKWLETRSKLDKALSSDQFWWASAKPWWSLEMIEQGAFSLKDVLNTLFSGAEKSEEVGRAEELYRKIIDQAFEWQRSGYVRKKHLEGSATFMKETFSKRTSDEWYNQMILEFEDEMNKAAKNRDFEKAIKWRDAILKLERGTDIYDVLHVVDELWTARQIPSVKPFLEHRWEEFSDFAREKFSRPKAKKEFEKWRKEKD